MVDYTMSGAQARYNIKKYLDVPDETPILRAKEPLTIPVKETHVKRGKACDAKRCMFSLAIHDVTGSPKHAVFRTITWAYMKNPRTGIWTLYYWQTPQLARDLLGENDAGRKENIQTPFYVTFPAVPAARDLEARKAINRDYRARVKAGVQSASGKKRMKYTTGKDRRIRVGGVYVNVNRKRGGGGKSEIIMPTRPVAPRSFGATA